MELKEKIVGDIMLVAVSSPRLDYSVSEKVKSNISERIGKGHQRLILDLGAVNFMDSSGLGALVACLKLMNTPSNFVLSKVSAPVMSLLKLTRMDQVFRIYPSEQEALDSFNSQGK